MNNPLVWGLYGMVGTGKSTVSKYLHSLGWNYINQDLLGHEVLKEYPHELAEIFGKEILIQNSVDRQKLGNIVFHDSKKLEQLMQFSYPIIVQKTLEHIDTKSTIIEGAFFYKVKQYIPYTHLLYVDVELSLLKQRLIQRGHTLDWIEQVIKNQQDILHHRYLADFILSNNNDTYTLHKQIDSILTQIHSTL